MLRVSVSRILFAEAALAAVFLCVVNQSEEGSNWLPALVGAAAVGGIVLFGKADDLGPISGVAVSFVMGVFVGVWLLAPRPMCVLGETDPTVGQEIWGTPVGLLFAYGFSAFVHRNDL